MARLRLRLRRLVSLVAALSFPGAVVGQSPAVEQEVAVNSVTLTDQLTIAAIIIGPIAAVLITLLIQHWYQKRQSKLWVLAQMISNRHQLLSVPSVQAMNTIDLVFSGRRDRKVRQVWREFVADIRNSGIGVEDKLKKYNELITEMCKALGYGSGFSHLDASRVLFPATEQAQPPVDPQIQELKDELLRVLKATQNLVTVKRQDEPENGA